MLDPVRRLKFRGSTNRPHHAMVSAMPSRKRSRALRGGHAAEAANHCFARNLDLPEQADFATRSGRPLVRALQNRAHAETKFACPFNGESASRRRRKNISLPFFRIRCHLSAIPARTRGASRSSRTLGWRCGGRDDVARRAMLSRTAKPCGPGIPTLMPSLQSRSAGDGGKKARSPGRARYKP
jgi:hypothetical protein